MNHLINSIRQLTLRLRVLYLTNTIKHQTSIINQLIKEQSTTKNLIVKSPHYGNALNYYTNTGLCNRIKVLQSNKVSIRKMIVILNSENYKSIKDCKITKGVNIFSNIYLNTFLKHC
jgi:hypothetical protein